MVDTLLNSALNHCNLGVLDWLRAHRPQQFEHYASLSSVHARARDTAPSLADLKRLVLDFKMEGFVQSALLQHYAEVDDGGEGVACLRWLLDALPAKRFGGLVEPLIRASKAENAPAVRLLLKYGVRPTSAHMAWRRKHAPQEGDVHDMLAAASVILGQDLK
jgi:hypothetical protein